MSDARRQADDWVLLFYVPYANDLWHCASAVFGSISSAFSKAARDPNRRRHVRVLLQYKLRGDAHMRRRHWHCDADVAQSDEEHEAAGSDADASCIRSLRSFLSWAEEHVAAAAHVGIAVLGHGGGVMEFCPEEVAGSGSRALRWMNVGEAAAELTRFNRSVNGRVGLVFLQNCCKAVLPAIWAFRELPCCLVASPTIIGAPNTYYQALIHHLFCSPAVSPASAAATICSGEQPQDFAILSVFLTASLPAFVRSLDAFAAAAAAAPLLRDAAALQALSLSLRSFWVEYLDILIRMSTATRQPITTLTSWRCARSWPQP
jgi:hypothetical protein